MILTRDHKFVDTPLGPGWFIFFKPEAQLGDIGGGHPGSGGGGEPSTGQILAVIQAGRRRRRLAEEEKREQEEAERLALLADEALHDDEQVAEAIEELRLAEYLPLEIESVKELAEKRSLVDELGKNQPFIDQELVHVMQCYFYFCEWKRRDEEDVAVLLLLM